MSDLNEPRDVELGKSLRELPVPEHGEHFWPKLATSLRRAAADSGNGGPKAARKTTRAWAAVPAVAALAALVAVVVFVLPRGGDDPVPAAVTPPVGMVTATAVLTQQALTTRYDIARAADGSFVETNPATGDTTAYDATSRTLVTWSTTGGTTRGRRETNAAPGGPDTSPRSLVLDRNLEDFVVAGHLSGYESITSLVIDGRTAVRYAGTVTPNALAGDGVNTIDAAVDEQTGVLRSLVRRAGRTEVSSMRLADFRVFKAVDRERFTPTPPPAAEMETIDRGFEALELAEARADDTVAGYGLAGAYEHSGAGEPTGPEGSNPPGRSIVSYLYLDGWYRVVVTTRVADAGGEWDDPFGFEGGRFDTDAVEIDGETAELAIDPTVVPHAWLKSSDDVITVSGAASEDDLVELLTVAKAV